MLLFKERDSSKMSSKLRLRLLKETLASRPKLLLRGLNLAPIPKQALQNSLDQY